MVRGRPSYERLLELAAATEIEYRKMPAPRGFDENNQGHVSQLVRMLADSGIGDGWEVVSFSREDNLVLFARHASIMSSTAGKDGQVSVSLGRMFKPSDADKSIAALEASPDHQGKFVVDLNPHLKRATLAPMTEDELNVRRSIATAMAKKPHEVRVGRRSGGGYDIVLPSSYLASKHDKKLWEITEEVAGTFGWVLKVNQGNLTASMLPAEPPTFEASIPYPFETATPNEDEKLLDWQMRIPVGQKLADKGEKNSLLCLDMADLPGVLGSGTAGGGKTVGVNAMIFGFLARGWEVAIGDVPHKAIDFDWVKPYVRDFGFGCSGPASTAAMVKHIYQEKDRRSALLAEHGAQKWQDLPAEVRPKPIVIIIDELQGLYTMETVPKIRDKDHPLVVAAEQSNYEVEVLKSAVKKIPAELRFAGIRILLWTQQAQANTGIEPSLKANLASRFLFGANPNSQARGHALLNPLDVPEVPEHIREDKAASRGVGVFEIEGVTPGVFKSFYETTDTYQRHLERLKVRKTATPEVTDGHIREYVGKLNDEAESEPAGYGHGPRQVEEWELGPDGQPLTGFERANAAKHQATVAAKTTDSENA